jgi:HK97 family phage prohead protease
MPAPTATMDERRTFRGNADTELEHPVDALGRVRWATTLDRSAINRADAGDAIGFTGHAAVFNSVTRIGSEKWGFLEQIAPGAFRKTITEADIRFLINHDPSLILARNRAGHLRLEEDDIGLSVDADVAPTSYGLDLAVSLERGDITQMSFSFEPVSWTREEVGDDVLYTLTEVRLWDVAVVTYPAYTDTDAALRSAAFDHLAHDLGVEPTTLLRTFADTGKFGDTITDLRPASRESTDGDETHEPPDGTRDESQPVETTGSNTPTPRQRELRRQTLAQRTQTMEV